MCVRKVRLLSLMSTQCVAELPSLCRIIPTGKIRQGTVVILRPAEEGVEFLDISSEPVYRDMRYIVLALFKHMS
jgi:hypothetical protein